jgi:hypothetical protein
MEIINKDELMDGCLDEALKLIRLITNEKEEEQHKRIVNDPVYHNVIRHIASMYFEFETNEAFKHKQEKIRVKSELLLKSLK